MKVLEVKYLYLLVFFISIMGCTNDVDELAYNHRSLVLDCSFRCFDSGTRAGEGNYNITDGAKLFLDFDGLRTFATYNAGSQNWILDEYPDDSKGNGTIKAFYYDLLNGTSATLEGIGTYTNSTSELRVSVELAPNTARIRFRGDASKIVNVTGLRCISNFNTNSYTWDANSIEHTLTIGANGYTPYVYATFANGTNLMIDYDGDTYTQTFPSNVLQPSKSGYIDLRKHEIVITSEFSISDYDEDILVNPTIN